MCGSVRKAIFRNKLGFRLRNTELVNFFTSSVIFTILLQWQWVCHLRNAVGARVR